jgi:3-oxoacyl-(acyl-carrier-protein) synthase
MSRSAIIAGIGLVVPGADALEGLLLHCQRAAGGARTEIETIPLPSGVKSQDARRMARLTRMALYAADSAWMRAGFSGRDGSVFVGLTHGSTSYFQEFHDYLFDYGPEMAGPNAFSNGVTNAPLGTVSKHLGLTAGGCTLAGLENCGLEALTYGIDTIARGESALCCVGAAEEYSPLVESHYRELGWYPGAVPAHLPHPLSSGAAVQGVGVSEGSVFLALSAPGLGDAARCRVTPVDNLGRLDLDVDLVISGAGGGPQDVCEAEALRSVLGRAKRPPALLFTKPFFGETFAVGSLLSVAVAWDIVTNGTAYPLHPASDDLRASVAATVDFARVNSVLVLAAARDGQVSAVTVSMH